MRLITWVDATEPVLEPMAVDSLHALGDTVGPRLSVDMMLERKHTPLVPKVAMGVGRLSLLLASAAAVPVGLVMGGLPGLAVAAAGGAMVYKKGLKLGFRGLGLLFSAWEGHQNPRLPPWTGVRTYEAGCQTGSQPLTRERDLDAVSDYLSRGMKRYPKEDLTVVYLTGHGLGYRQSAGLKQAEFDTLLEKTTQKAGRPIDVLMLESCLEGNLETVAGVGDRARYVVVSEETISAGALGGRIREVSRRGPNGPLTPSGWARSVVRCSWGDGLPVDTLAVVDTRQLPPAMQALDELGALLRQELEENPAALKAAVDATTTFPKEFPFRSDGKRLGLGDIGHFCRNLQRIYRGREVTVPLGPFQREVSFPEAAASPRARAILEAAVKLREKVDEAIIERYTSESYREASGLSVQLPTRHLGKIDKKLPGFAESAAPPRWQDFVTAMSGRL